MKSIINKISSAVSKLPEVYQPIYGHPELSENPSRLCNDRLKEILKIFNNLKRNLLKKNVRVLDLGCAQGYISLSLASNGAEVHGVDYLDSNIALCKLLAEENKYLNLSFEKTRIEETINSLIDGQYDLVLGLSIFHHLAHESGFDYVKSLVSKIISKSGCLICETALREEPMYWAKSQPIDPKLFFDDLFYSIEIKKFDNHLSNIKRPMFFVSDKYISIGSIFDTKLNIATKSSKHFKNPTYLNTRKYILGNDFFYKYYSFKMSPMRAVNLREFKYECNFSKFNLLNNKKINLPKIEYFQSNKSEGVVVFEKIKGELLLDKLLDGYDFDFDQLIFSIIKQLTYLESKGFYYRDLRPWNLMINDKNDVFFIDISSISTVKTDVTYPNNIYHSFFYFIQQFFTKQIQYDYTERSGSILLENFPEYYKSWIYEILKTGEDEISFNLILKYFIKLQSIKVKNKKYDYIKFKSFHNIINNGVYDAFMNLSKIHHENNSYLSSTEAKLTSTEAKLTSTEAKLTSTEAKLTSTEAKLTSTEAKLTDLQMIISQKDNFIEELNNNYNQILSSSSWRITKPLRLLRRNIYKFRLKFILEKSFFGLKNIIKKFKFITNDVVPNSNFLGTQSHFDFNFDPLEGYIFYYVDHTCIYESSTGVQRLAREFAKQLLKNGEKIIFVKWDTELGFIPLNSEQLKNFEKWDGPKLSSNEMMFYLNNKIIPESFYKNPNNLLLIPEVPYINYHDRPLTYDVLKRSKVLGLKVGAIFYDATPLRSPELIDIADTHSEYMKHLLLCDYVWPISDFVKNDLLTFWHHYQLADNKTMPFVNTITLPANHSSIKRQASINKNIESKIILCVGSIDKRKNQITLINAFTSLREQNLYTGWKLILVGNCSKSLHKEVIDSTKNGFIEYLHNISNDRLDELYRQSAFTVFPSLIEGFGLPILESLWYGKPCICANFGSMLEVANSHGGCLTVDVSDQKSIANSISLLIENKKLRNKLTLEAKSSEIKTWDLYTNEIISHHRLINDSRLGLGFIFYDITHTGVYQSNSGIQRVVRQVAKSFLNQGYRLIPVYFEKGEFKFATKEHLNKLACFNGPDSKLWSSWNKSNSENAKWYFSAELNHDNDDLFVKSRNFFLKKFSLKSAIIFYDTIPWDMRDIYPPAFYAGHKKYLIDLCNYDLLFSISNYSAQTLRSFYLNNTEKFHSFSDKFKTVSLGVDFKSGPRTHNNAKNLRNTKIINILSVGTVEPRKNHVNLIKAFLIAEKKLDTKNVKIRLNIVGGDISFDHSLPAKIEEMISNHKNIKWHKYPSDDELINYYKKSHFTIFQSIMEGFGLPILESLWYKKPCICSNSGAMGEVSSSGGCLHADVSDVNDLAKKICDLILKESLYIEKVKEINHINFKSWNHYVNELAFFMNEKQKAEDVIICDEYKNNILKKEEIKTLRFLKNINKKPKLSICITTYNRAKWLNLSLNNIFKLLPVSKNNEIEIIVCDNASTDNTSKILEKFKKRPDFHYYRNKKNVGMLGNLKETVNLAKGDYIYILGDDDILLQSSIDSIMGSIKKYPKVPLIYLNYSYTNNETPSDINDIKDYIQSATPATNPEKNIFGKVKDICAQNENFFTAIYTLVLRRDHALKLYSQSMNGRPFSSMMSCIPSTLYILKNMMNETAVWIGHPQVVINLNVSWLKYATLWHLERFPEIWEVAENCGASSDKIQKLRNKNLLMIVTVFKEMFLNEDQRDNSQYFSPDIFFMRAKKIEDFDRYFPELKDLYISAYKKNHPGAKISPKVLFDKNV